MNIYLWLLVVAALILILFLVGLINISARLDRIEKTLREYGIEW